MTPDGTGDGMSQIGVYVPTNVKEALYLLAHARSEPRQETSMSALARDYIEQGLAQDIQQSDDVPEEVRDLLDDNLESDGGESELTVDAVEEVHQS